MAAFLLHPHLTSLCAWRERREGESVRRAKKESGVFLCLILFSWDQCYGTWAPHSLHLTYLPKGPISTAIVRVGGFPWSLVGHDSVLSTSPPCNLTVTTPVLDRLSAIATLNYSNFPSFLHFFPSCSACFIFAHFSISLPGKPPVPTLLQSLPWFFPGRITMSCI